MGRLTEAAVGHKGLSAGVVKTIALISTDKEGVLALANEGHLVMKPQDIIRYPFVLEFTGLPKKKKYKGNFYCHFPILSKK